jgi:hemerythrin-like domain-containing protein
MDKRSAPVDALAKAHRALRKALRKLEDALHSPQEIDPAETSRRLERMRKQLTDHFRLEEENGYMTAVLEREPHLERTVEHLRDEHHQLADTLSRLIEEAKKIDQLDDGLREHIRAWLERIRQHEARENRLVQDVFNLDIDAED